MRGLLLRLLVIAVTIFVTPWLVPGVHVAGVVPALVAAVVLGLVNAIVRPVLVLLTFPLTLLTLGLFLLVLNAVCFWLASVLVPGFDVAGFVPAFLGALMVSLVSWLATRLIG